MSCTWRAGAPGPSMGCPNAASSARRVWEREPGVLGAAPGSPLCFVSGSRAAQANKAPELVMDERGKSFASCKLLCKPAVSLPFTQRAVAQPNSGIRDQSGLSAALPGGVTEQSLGFAALYQNVSFWASLCKTGSAGGAEGGKFCIL